MGRAKIPRPRADPTAPEAPLRVVVVGQTPPPFGGQAIAIQMLLEGRYDTLVLSHVRMGFSRDISEIGALQLRKVAQLPWLVVRILWARLRHRAQVLYYVPTGSNLVPLIRDIVVLVCCRWAFRWTVLHFHAAGLTDLYPRLTRSLRWAFRRAYFGADVAIVLSGGSPYTGFFSARHVAVVADGVADDAARYLDAPRLENPEPVILFVGAVRQSKGVLVLLDACARLQADGVAFQARLVGECQPPVFATELAGRITSLGLSERVRLLGRRVDDEKWAEFCAADLMCFPTFLDEFGLVAVEAMEFELPVVATRCPGLETIVEDGKTGYLVDVGDSEALAEAMKRLLDSPDLRRSMGAEGRRAYLARFTVQRYRRDLEEAIASARQSAVLPAWSNDHT